jgi:hypothetical protein
MLFKIENASIEEVDTEETRTGTGERSVVLVHPSKSKMHMRRAIKNFGSADSKEVTWLCSAHNGTYVYVHDDGDKVTVMVTDQDMKP